MPLTQYANMHKKIPIFQSFLFVGTVLTPLSKYLDHCAVVQNVRKEVRFWHLIFSVRINQEIINERAYQVYSNSLSWH